MRRRRRRRDLADDPMLSKIQYWTVSNDRRPRKRKKNNSLLVGFILIGCALMIVAASKLMAGPEQITPSYGFQQTAADSVKKETKAAKQADFEPGAKIDEYQGVAVYSNGTDYMSNHGLNYSTDGYYYGYKWQCVEFVKRFYYEKFGLKMPDGAGNAKYFYNPLLEQGDLNPQRGLIQYQNGGDVKPKVNDLLVFTDGAYGHVAVISEVGKDWLEVVQQNSEVTREKYTLQEKDGKYFVLGERKPAGWLRIPN
jgi:surface antigen